MLAVDSRLRKTPSQARSRQTVDAFLEAADRILRSDGYASASTNRLARVAGFSVGSLYQYFDDKQAVVGTLVDRELRREARDLATVLDRHSSEDLTELLRPSITYLIEHRLEAAHIHRALAHHSDEFGEGGALTYLARQQGPLAGEALQRAASGPLLRTGDLQLEPRLRVASGLVQVVTHTLAVETPAHVPSDALAEALVHVVSRYVSASDPPGQEACELIARWGDDAKRDRSAHERRARRMQEVRTFMLRSADGDLDTLESAVFVGSGVYDLVFAGQLRPGDTHSPDELAPHFARLLEALPR